MVMVDRKDRVDWTNGRDREKEMHKVDRKDRVDASNGKDDKLGSGKVDRIDRARHRGTMISKFLRNF